MTVHNLSDHLPLCLTLGFDFTTTSPRSAASDPGSFRMRWDKADLDCYYQRTFCSLHYLLSVDCLDLCDSAGTCNRTTVIDSFYDQIIYILGDAAYHTVPRKQF